MPSDGFEMRVELARGGTVSAAVALPSTHRPGRTPVVILAHGAGTDRRHPSLVRVQEGLRDAGWPVVLFNFPYREAGKRVPDARPALEGCWRAVIGAVRAEPRLAPPWIVIGGRSMGGRIASHVAAEGADVRGLVFLAFPLHAAGRPSTERATHLSRITVPMLFVQGTRDSLADRTLLGVFSPRCRRRRCTRFPMPITASAFRAAAGATTPRCAARSSSRSRNGWITCWIDDGSARVAGP